MPALGSVRGLHAVVTGASSGIGRLIALRLAREGARVGLVARRADALDALAGAIRADGGDALVLPCDVAERAQVESAADRALAHFGPVDLLVNNAGYGRHQRFLDWDVDDIERITRVNYLGSVYWTKRLLPAMVARRQGWIVFLASVAGRIGVPDESAYAASKFAMVGLAEALTSEVEDAGVHVLTVCPGAVRTDFVDAASLPRMPEVSRRTMVEPEPLVDAIFAALAAGKHELTYPRFIAASYVVRAIAPRFMRRNVKRRTIGAKPADP
jgi:3-oxoacyl-[acyl-carrier protein] reductase